MVPSYLQFSLENLAKEQEKFRTQFASAFSNPAGAFEIYQDTARKNIADVRAGAVHVEPVHGGSRRRQARGSAREGRKGRHAEESDELGELKAQLASMQQKIDKLSQDRE